MAGETQSRGAAARRFGAGAAKLILGGRFERALWPVLATVAMNFTGFGTLTSYFGLWLIQAQHVDVRTVSTALFCAGLAGACGAGFAGTLVDRLGPRRVNVAIATLHAAATIALAFPVGTGTAIGLLAVVTGTQPLRGVAQRTLIGQLGQQTGGEKAFADYRLVLNVGLLSGPLMGAVVLQWGWQALRIDVCVLYFLALLPAVALYRTPETPAAGPRAPVVRPAARLLDRKLILLVAGSSCAWTVMYVYEAVLPILVVGSETLSASQWGLLYSLGPLLALVGQLRVQRWFRAFRPSARLAGGVLLMGFAFAVFWGGFRVWVLPVFIVLFVLGDLVWGPASEDVAVRAAPEGRTGAYLGAVSSTVWVGSALAPAVGLPAAQHYGNGVLWAGAAALSVVSALCYANLSRLAR
ncbi:MFS transporter [Amycolatopsis silviterrae]|uniref:MFS transporter n=1 Tax=Amycolatopsis silviterrae TaxID=1656914 RepID=A0ABW5H3C6_9PSEU